jgi:RHS repeat-associated protein
VKYLTRSAGFTLFLANDGAYFDLARPGSRTTRDVLALRFEGATATPTLTGQNPLTSTTNYFVGSDPTAWHANVPNFGKVVYGGLATGLAVSFYGNPARQLEFDLTVQPGTAPTGVTLRWDGAQSLTTDAQGNLLIQYAGGTIVQKAPTFYQMTAAGQRQTVTAAYDLRGGTRFGFQPGTYDTTRPLVLDPVLAYSSYLGGSGDDLGYGIAVDDAGNAYVTGETTSASFTPTTGVIGSPAAGNSHVFVAKLNAAGTGLVYTTIVGGSGAERGNGIAVDLAGNAYVAGTTSSTNFPVSANPYQASFPSQDFFTGPVAFVAKLSASGSDLEYSTYLAQAGTGAHGATVYVPTQAFAVAVDANGNAFVVGDQDNIQQGPFETDINPGPGFGSGGAGTYDGWLAEVKADGTTLGYDDVIGGSGDEHARGVALDAGGNAYVTGDTTSTNFPVPNGFQTTSGGGGDAWVAEVASGGASQVYGSYLGGSGTDVGNAIAVNPLTGVATVTGSTTGNFTTTNGAYQTTYGGGAHNAFVSRIARIGGTASLTYSTYLHGSGDDIGKGIALDRNGYVTVTGSTTSTDFPTYQALQSTNAGGTDAFVTRLTPTGTLAYSSYLGGSGYDSGNAVAVDLVGDAYVAGTTTSTNFPTVNAVQSANQGGYDAFVAKIVASGAPPPAITAISPDTGYSDHDQITNNQHLTLSGTAPATATVTLYRADQSSAIGTTTATSGNWTFDYTSTTLAEDTYAFTATDTLNGVTSDPSPAFLVTVDLTPPTVTLALPATSSFAPLVRVNAWDQVGIPATTTVTFDFDLNHDGFATSWENGYATGTMVNGFLQTNLTNAAHPIVATGSYSVRAHVDDLAGNTGTSAVGSLVISANANTSLNAYVIEHDPFDGLPTQSMGVVGLSHSLDLDRSPGTVQGGSPALVYQSDTVSPAPVVQGVVAVDTVTAPPASVTVTATLTWDSSTVHNTYTITNLHPGDTFVVAVQAPAGQTNGAHSWALDVSMDYESGVVLHKSGITYVVNLAGSALGAGWSLSNVDRLIDVTSPGPAGKLWAYGGGGWRFFTSTGTMTYSSPANDNGSLALSGSNYVYTGADGHTETFNSSGYETSWTSADGNEQLAFTYDLSNRVSTETAIDGALTTFNYSGGLLSTIQTVNGRTYTMVYSGNDLTSITDPGGGTDTFGYTSDRPTSETFGGLQNQWGYDSGSGMANSLTRGNSNSPTVSTLVPQASQGLTVAVLGQPQAMLTDVLGDKQTWQLDQRGRPTQYTDALGAVTTYMLDSAGRVTATTDPLGRTTTLTRDSNTGYVTQEQLPDGSMVTMAYDTAATHDLTKLIDQLGNVTTYQYDSQGHQTAKIDALGKYTTMTYYPSGAAAGLLQSVTDPLNHTTTYSYDNYRRLSVVTDALLHATTYTYDANGNPSTTTDALGHMSTTLYDALGRQTGSIDALGNRNTVTYDAAGLQLTTTDAAGMQTSTVYDTSNRGLVVDSIEGVGTAVQRDNYNTYDSAGRLIATRNADGWTTQMALDADGRVTQTTDPKGNVSRSEFDLAGQQTETRDAMGRWTASQYDLRGRVTQTTDPTGALATSLYDALNLTASIDLAGNRTTYQYDPLNRQTVVIDPLTKHTTTAYDVAGNVLSVADVLGTTTSYGYDESNRQTAELAAVTVADSGTASGGSTTTLQDSTKSWTSALVGKTVVITAGVGAGQTAIISAVNSPTQVTFQTALQTALGAGSVYQFVSGGRTRTTAYDAVGKVTATTDALNHTTTYLYDAANRQTGTIDALTNRTTSVLDAVGDVTKTFDALGKLATMVLDALHRTIGNIDPLNHQTTQVLDAEDQQVGSIDALGDVSQTGDDSDGEPVAQVDARGDLTRTLYDRDGNVIQRIDPDGNTWQYFYDKDNRETLRIDPLGATVTTSYDTDGRVTQVIDRDSRTMTMAYDTENRLTSETWSSGNVLTYTYDNAGNTLTAKDHTGTITNSYDALGRLTATTDVFGLTLNYSYDNADRVTEVDDSKGGVLTSSYDSSDRLTVRRFSDGTNQARVNLAYDNADRMTGVSRYSDAAGATLAGTTSYAYDDASRVTAITSKNAVGTALSTYSYLFDNADRVTQESWSSGASSGTHTYGYDTTNQLTAADSTTFGYDANGNRNYGSYQTGTGNRTTNDGTYTYTYDGEGNLTQKSKGTGLETWYYTYDQRSLLTSVRETTNGTTNEFAATYTYDALGRRVQQDRWTGSSVVTTEYAFDANNRVWAELNGSNAAQYRYLNGDGPTTVFARINVGSGSVAWLIQDHLDTVRDVVDSTQVNNHTETDAFGVITSETNAANGVTFVYTGLPQDRYSMLVFATNRVLDPKTAKWLQQDPIMFQAGDPNLYRDVGNNAANMVDPSGLENKKPWNPVGPLIAAPFQGLAALESLVTDSIFISELKADIEGYQVDHVRFGPLTDDRYRWVQWNPINRDSVPKHIGTLDQERGTVERDGYVVSLAKVIDAAEAFLGPPGDWATWFKDQNQTKADFDESYNQGGFYQKVEGISRNRVSLSEMTQGVQQIEGLAKFVRDDAVTAGLGVLAQSRGLLTGKSLERALPGGHVFDRHAHEWFGVKSAAEFRAGVSAAQIKEWRSLIEYVGRSRITFEWTLGRTPTIAHLAKVQGKYFVVQYYKDTGVLASAFVPKGEQLAGMLRALAAARE